MRVAVAMEVSVQRDDKITFLFRKTMLDIRLICRKFILAEISMKNETLMEIDKCLRGYDLMLIETGGRYDGQGILDKCLVLSELYIDTGGCIDNLYHIAATIIKEYEKIQKNHQWKYYDNMVELLNTYVDKLRTK